MNGIELIVIVVSITVVLTEAMRMYLTVCIMRQQRDEAYDKGRRSEQIDNAFAVQGLIDEKNQLRNEKIELKEKCKELEIRLKEARGEK